mgnify:FL=1
MSIIYRKKNGYPCDLELKAEEHGDWFDVSIIINGAEQIGLMYSTKYLHETRKAWAKGFFAGITYAENKRS